MNNLLILYNPYYQSDVVEQHLKVLIEHEKVAFGKVRSKLKSQEHSFENELSQIYKSTDETNHLQLFLTDYANLFVAKVTQVTKENMSHIAPKYYSQKGLEVEQWYIITDIRELVRSDFETMRDNYLSNFITPSFANHTYAIYGNSYEYPLVVAMKQEINYFEDKEDSVKYYPDVYKSDEFLEIKNNLISYTFGAKYVNFMHPDTMNNIISAEIEYRQNHTNPLHDFSSVVVKYSKTIEQELYLFMKYLVKFLAKHTPKILDIRYIVQSREYRLADIFTNKPNLGTYKFILKNNLIDESLRVHCDRDLKFYISKNIPNYINTVQDIRNETVHGSPPRFEDVKILREKIIGVACESMMIEIIKIRAIGFETKEKRY